MQRNFRFLLILISLQLLLFIKIKAQYTIDMDQPSCAYFPGYNELIKTTLQFGVFKSFILKSIINYQTDPKENNADDVFMKVIKIFNKNNFILRQANKGEVPDLRFFFEYYHVNNKRYSIYVTAIGKEFGYLRFFVTGDLIFPPNLDAITQLLDKLYNGWGKQQRGYSAVDKMHDWENKYDGKYTNIDKANVITKSIAPKRFFENGPVNFELSDNFKNDVLPKFSKMTPKYKIESLTKKYLCNKVLARYYEETVREDYYINFMNSWGFNDPDLFAAVLYFMLVTETNNTNNNITLDPSGVNNIFFVNFKYMVFVRYEKLSNGKPGWFIDYKLKNNENVWSVGDVLFEVIMPEKLK